MIVHDSGPVTLIGGANVAYADLTAAQAIAPWVVAADGGADTALAQGVMPEAVIGDFDSISADARTRIPAERLHPIAEQDSSDFDKCLRNIEAPLIVGLGFSGARLDHQLAACNTLVCHPHHRCLLVGSDDLVFLCPPSLKLDLPKDCPVSLFPMGAVEGVSDGLTWPIAGLNFAPDGQIGTSNRAKGAVHLSLTAPKMLVMVPRVHLTLVADALLAAPARW
ncbi:thiamine diphosphokinase [Roseovarius sp. ZX-A-9]|uniref:thiamine diphosphokinase n=1 Tax=Roseovarius sp. ZX-A-9 TaxID=3014783 RepID=UPI00232F9127|nr:thiamine diphosphokinase [Roseovarius sp. ZX-A-9]